MPAFTTAERTARLASALIARRELQNVVRVLNRVGILPMPLKGVLLQHLVYRDPADRLLSDVDLLVGPARFDDAVRALREEGYALAVEGRAAIDAKAQGARLEIDLHRRLFSPGLFGLRAEQLFERGRIDERTFDAVVVLPTPEDLYAHLIGNFAKGRHRASDVDQVRDLGAVASRFALAPGRIARHLQAHGLARAARYTLGHTPQDRFAQEVLRVLGPDRVGALLANGARQLSERYGSRSTASLLALHALNGSLLGGARSLAMHVALGARSRVLNRLARRSARSE